MDKPEIAGESVYSNFDHVLELSEDEVKESNQYHQHAAWDFCGYVWYDKDTDEFVDEIWRYNSIVDELRSKSLRDVIHEANREYGSD